MKYTAVWYVEISIKRFFNELIVVPVRGFGLFLLIFDERPMHYI